MNRLLFGVNLTRRILDRQIDVLVYDLYALTSAEIKIVEGAAA